MVNGQRRTIQLQNGQMDGGDEHRTHHAALPATVRSLTSDDILQRRFLVLRPRQAIGLLGFGEEFGATVVAEAVDGLRIVIVSILIVLAYAIADGKGHVVLAEDNPFLDLLGVVFASAEAAGNGSRCQGGSAAVGLAQPVDHSTLCVGAFVEIVLGFIDDFLGHGDAGVAGSAQALKLGYGNGTFIKVATVGCGDIAPAASCCLRLAAEEDGAGENVFQLLAPVRIIFFPLDAGHEQECKTMAIHVAAGLAWVTGIADHAVGLAARHESHARA